ncbi:hypothetical protein [Saccharopolyspora taberi]|uniref:Conjugal transfer protein TraD n=1 Tax=Saccharopolyspora taberi TaxID=60895 RepID=A0ABN3V0M2_9PSEU
MPTARRTPRKLRRFQRAAAFHNARATTASTPAAQFRAAADALISAAKHTRNIKQVRDLRQQIAQHAKWALEASGANDKSRAHGEQTLAKPGSESQRLGIAVMVLQGAINALPATERDSKFEFYIEQFKSESSRIDTLGGVRL